MEHDGFSLDDKRQRVPENDIPDVLACWQHRHDPKFQKQRTARLAELQKQIAPLKKERLDHHALIHRLKFEEVVAQSPGKQGRVTASPREPDSSGASPSRADDARAARERRRPNSRTPIRIAPLEKEINQTHPPVLGDEGTSRRPELRSSPPTATARSNRKTSSTKTRRHAGTDAATGTGGSERRRRDLGKLLFGK